MYERQFWHPVNGPRAVIKAGYVGRFGGRLPCCISIDVNTLQSSPTIDAGGETDVLKKYGLDSNSVDSLTSEKAILKYLEAVYRKMEKDGWEETPKSLSRRVFINRETPPGKYWSIFLEPGHILAKGKPLTFTDSCTCGVEFGKAENKRGRLFAGGANSSEKSFATREEALEHYHKLIRQKTAKGYVELYPRETAYSSPPVSDTPAKKPARRK